MNGRQFYTIREVLEDGFKARHAHWGQEFWRHDHDVAIHAAVILAEAVEDGKIKITVPRGGAK